MTGVAVDPGLKGSFSPIALTQVLTRLASESRSGQLQIVSGNWIKTIGVDGGAIRSASSNMRQDRLGESMLAHACISESDFHTASERMRSDGCRFGEALVKMGRLEPKEIDRQLAVQTQRIVLSLFRVSEGLYSFDETAESANRLPFTLSVPPLLLKGIRRVDDGRLILGALPPAHARVRASAAPAFSLDRDKVSAVERAVLERAAAGATIGEIVRDPALSRSAAMRACYALIELGILELVDDAAPTGELDPEALRQRIESQHVELDAVDEADLLGVPADASEEALERAYKSVGASWRSIREQTADAGLLAKVDAIEFRLAAAYHQLLIERKRHAEEEIETGDEGASGDGDGRAARIQQLARDARLHLHVKDCEGALSLLHELVALSPDTASYQVMMGRAMLLHPNLDQAAEAHFLHAIELEPENADLHVAIGRYYQRMRQPSRAAEALTKALELDPDHVDAQRYLDSQPETKGVKRLFHRLFGVGE